MTDHRPSQDGPMHATTNLAFGQTLYRLIRFMGEHIEVSRRYPGGTWTTTGILHSGQSLDDDTVLFNVGESNCFVLEASTHIAAETIGDNVMRIETTSGAMMISIALDA